MMRVVFIRRPFVFGSAGAWAALATALGCGSSSTPNSGPSPNGYVCAAADPAAKPAACTDCLRKSCESALTDAYGAGWETGMVAGACPSSFATCAKKCSCDDSNCSSSCLDAAGNACKSAVSLAFACIAALCGGSCQ